MEEKIKSIMSRVFNIDEALIDSNCSSDTIEKWDSMGQMELLSALEEEFDTRFSDREITEMVSFNLIQGALAKKLGSNG